MTKKNLNLEKAQKVAQKKAREVFADLKTLIQRDTIERSQTWWQKNWKLALKGALVVLVLYGALVLIAAGNKSEMPVAGNPSHYPPNPERTIDITCNDVHMNPQTIEISPGEFITLRFKNEAEEMRQGFGIKTKDGVFINATRAIDPRTFARFSWRVPRFENKTQMLALCFTPDNEALNKTGNVIIE